MPPSPAHWNITHSWPHRRILYVSLSRNTLPRGWPDKYNTNTQTPFIHETGMSFLCSPFTHICCAVSSETSVLSHSESSVYHWLNTPLWFTSYMLLTNQDELSINWMPSKPKPHFQENKKRKTKKVHMTSLGWANMDHVTWVLHWLYLTVPSHRYRDKQPCETRPR